MEDKEEEIDDDEAISTQVPTSCNLVMDFFTNVLIRSIFCAYTFLSTVSST